MNINTHKPGYLKRSLLWFCTSFLFLISITAHALPFSVVPAGGLPTSVPQGGTVTAAYVVTNNTGSTRNNNFVKYLPPNVSVAPGGCAANFNLGPHGWQSQSCILNLLVSGPVNANDPDPHHHLFVCFPKGITCAGTNFPLNVSVGPAAVASISITPVTATIFPTGIQQYTAIATFTNGTTQNVTTSVIWHSSNTAIATINNTGLATGINPGTVAITATSGAINSNTATLVVQAVVLTSISITPVNATISLTGTEQYTAIGHFNNGTTQDITTSVSWHSSTPAVATIANTGLASAVSIGATTITATSGAITSNAATLHVASFLYVSNNSTGTILACSVGADGTLGSCNTVVSGLNDPQFISINPAGTILYIANQDAGNVLACPITSPGNIGSCLIAASGFTRPTAVTLNPAGNIGYVVENQADIVLQCPVNSDGTFGTCVNTGGNNYVSPNGIAFTPDGTLSYVSNLAPRSSFVTFCTVNADGSFSACNATGTFVSPFGIVVANFSGVTKAYVASLASPNGFNLCTIVTSNPGRGTFSSCSATSIVGGGVALNAAQTFVYIAGPTTNVINECPVNPDGTLGTCNTATGFSAPVGVAIQ